MDSTQMWFCRDLWTDAAKDGLKQRAGNGGHRKLAGGRKRDLNWDNMEAREAAARQENNVKLQKRDPVPDPDPQAGPAAVDDKESSDQDAIDEEAGNPAPEPLKPQDLPASAFLIPNSVFTPARILVNPRCVTTYGGVSHTQLALDLFGGPDRDEPEHKSGNYVLEDWAGPPDSFVCQEMRTTGGRTAPKSQRRVGFLLQNEVGAYVLIPFLPAARP